MNFDNGRIGQIGIDQWSVIRNDKWPINRIGLMKYETGEDEQQVYPFDWQKSKPIVRIRIYTSMSVGRVDKKRNMILVARGHQSW